MDALDAGAEDSLSRRPPCSRSPPTDSFNDVVKALEAKG